MRRDLDLHHLLQPLRTLVEKYDDHNVTAVFEVSMGGQADSQGALVWPREWVQITKPAARRKEPQVQDEETEDSMEELDVTGWFLSSHPGLDTDIDSVASGDAEENPTTLPGRTCLPNLAKRRWRSRSQWCQCQQRILLMLSLRVPLQDSVAAEIVSTKSGETCIFTW